jgi:hypothetical protein
MVAYLPSLRLVCERHGIEQGQRDQTVGPRRGDGEHPAGVDSSARSRPFCHPASRVPLPRRATARLHMLRATRPSTGASGNTGPIAVIAGVRIGAASANIMQDRIGTVP